MVLIPPRSQKWLNGVSFMALGSKPRTKKLSLKLRSDLSWETWPGTTSWGAGKPMDSMDENGTTYLCWDSVFHRSALTPTLWTCLPHIIPELEIGMKSEQQAGQQEWSWPGAKHRKSFGVFKRKTQKNDSRFATYERSTKSRWPQHPRWPKMASTWPQWGTS